MGVQINIKSQKARSLLDEIVMRTGLTATEAVTQALQKQLNELTRDEKLARVRAISKECGPLWAEPWKSMEHGEMLYDEDGMPN